MVVAIIAGIVIGHLLAIFANIPDFYGFALAVVFGFYTIIAFALPIPRIPRPAYVVVISVLVGFFMARLVQSLIQSVIGG